MVNDDVFEPPVLEAIRLAVAGPIESNITSGHLLLAAIKVADRRTLWRLQALEGITGARVAHFLRLGEVQEPGPDGDFSTPVRDILERARSTAAQDGPRKISLQDLVTAILETPGSAIAARITSRNKAVDDLMEGTKATLRANPPEKLKSLLNEFEESVAALIKEFELENTGLWTVCGGIKNLRSVASATEEPPHPDFEQFKEMHVYMNEGLKHPDRNPPTFVEWRRLTLRGVADQISDVEALAGYRLVDVAKRVCKLYEAIFEYEWEEIGDELTKWRKLQGVD